MVGNRVGEWIFGYNRHVGKCSVFDVELWGILDGLVLLQRQGYNKIVIHSNSLQVIKGICDSSLVDSNFVLIRRIHHILSHVEHWSLRYVSRKKNRVDDCLVKMSINKKEDLQVYDSMPREVLELTCFETID
ncbi:hypothetical protein Goshw_013595, partial [Gossypium schwendimanii]|nr:hypothetical protein [Gossypium schwendimanii]